MTKPTRSQVEKAAREMYSIYYSKTPIEILPTNLRRIILDSFRKLARWHLARGAEVKEKPPLIVMVGPKSPATKAKKGRVSR